MERYIEIQTQLLYVDEVERNCITDLMRDVIKGRDVLEYLLPCRWKTLAMQL